MVPLNTDSRVLISACLVGQLVRYDAVPVACMDPEIRRWRDHGILVPFCPEVAAGLPVPRPPAEIIGGDGPLVLRRKAPILDTTQKDVTDRFIIGAQRALALARSYNARVAILKDGSPSCGSTCIYDGTHSGKLRAGQGVTTALLRRHGVVVWSEEKLSCLPTVTSSGKCKV